jgi:hypothetical protein
MRTVLLLALAALTACSTYARVAHTNAPGVMDLNPPTHETGTDDEYFEPSQPGSQSYVAWLVPAFGGGMVRHGTGLDLSVGVAVEKDRDDGRFLPIASDAWGGAIGLDIVQFRSEPNQDAMITNSGGPFWFEVYRRTKSIMMIGAGPVVYPDTRDLGAQITFHAPLVQGRVRWAQDTGFEATFAYELALPAVFGWSR